MYVIVLRICIDWFEIVESAKIKYERGNISQNKWELTIDNCKNYIRAPSWALK